MAYIQPVDNSSLLDNMDDILYVKKSGRGKPKHRGYKREYLAQNLSDLEKEISICKICEGIMRKASIVREETTCQVCSDTPDQLNAVRLVDNCVSKLEIKCPLLRGCEWKGKLSEAENHLSNCMLFLITCDNCRAVVTRGNMNDHKQNICTIRKIGCEICDKKVTAKNYKEHLEYCNEYPIICPNECGKGFPRSKLSEHMAECPLAEIECPYTKYGCKAIILCRKALLSHKKEFIIEHMDMVEMANRTLRVKNDDLEVRVDRLELELNTVRRSDGLKWELRNVDKLTKEQVITSPEFYVQKYKLKCVCLERTELQFAIQRVRGKFDDSLGPASITEYRLVLQSSDGTQSCHDGKMNYQLKVGTVSDVFANLNTSDYSHFLTQDRSLTILFYFDVWSSEPPSDSSDEADFIFSFDPLVSSDEKVHAVL